MAREGSEEISEPKPSKELILDIKYNNACPNGDPKFCYVVCFCDLDGAVEVVSQAFIDEDDAVEFGKMMEADVLNRFEIKSKALIIRSKLNN